jgi:hypothetical protein
MPTDHIIQLLIAERDRLNQVIELLTGSTKRPGRPRKDPLANAPDWVLPKAKPERKKRKFTAAQRKAQAEEMRLYWKTKRKAAKG